MLLLAVLVAMSIIAFILYGLDKGYAKKGTRRIPERVLLGFSILGGGIGGALGMMLFRHKTKHWYFVVLNLLGIAIQIAAILIAFG